MILKIKFKFIFIFVALTGAFFLLAGTASANQQFFVDPSYDWRGRDQIAATLLLEGNRARYFVEDTHWNTLNSAARSKLLNDITGLSDSFDKDIYNQVTRIFGLEWRPGIDNDIKITILFTHMITEAGGYFQTRDELPRTIAPNSNEREMFYVNILHAGEARSKAFLAHELQHLINYNQKTRIRNLVEDTWLNEMMSEMAPSLIGLDDIYEASNLENRVASFLQNTGDALLDWQSNQKDYASINLFGQYMRERYGKEFFTSISLSRKIGVGAINDALESVGSPDKFEDIFIDWVITLIINDCSVVPVDKYCYTNPNLSADNLLITFPFSSGRGERRISFSETTQDWAGNWFSFMPDEIEAERPSDHVFHFTFDGSIPSAFSVPYVIFYTDGTKKVKNMIIEGGAGEFAVTDFGYLVDKIVVMPINQYRTQGTGGNASYTRFMLDAQIQEELPAILDITLDSSQDAEPVAPIILPEISIPNGSLIRAVGRDEVYIVNGLYRRWIQDAQIIDFYGHLRWEDVIEVSDNVLGQYINSNVIRFIDDPRVYQVSSIGIKSWITSEAEFLSLGYTFGMVYEVNEKEFNFYR